MMDIPWEKMGLLLEQRRQAFGTAAGVLSNCRFEKDSGEVRAMSHIRNYVSQWETFRQENIGLVLWGPPGTGKTFAAGCIANALMEQGDSFPPKVIMATFGTILRQLLAKCPEEKDSYIRALISCDLLILDDLGMERQTEYAREQVFNIIDGRCQSEKPMIVTTNLSLQQMKAPQTLEEQRIYDRVLGCCVPVCFEGTSHRSAAGAEKIRRFRQVTGQ